MWCLKLSLFLFLSLMPFYFSALSCLIYPFSHSMSSVKESNALCKQIVSCFYEELFLLNQEIKTNPKIHTTNSNFSKEMFRKICRKWAAWWLEKETFTRTSFYLSERDLMKVCLRELMHISQRNELLFAKH